jgi:hypothetical protein
MSSRFTLDDELIAGSADQRELLRLARVVRAELLKRTDDIGCMTPDEMCAYLDALDKLQDLHVWASLHDDRIASYRGGTSGGPGARISGDSRFLHGRMQAWISITSDP